MPLCIQLLVSVPTMFCGFSSSILGSFAAVVTRDSVAVLMPGAIAPPRYVPSFVTRLNVVAEPKSTTITGPPYSLYAAAAPTILSVPNCPG